MQNARPETFDDLAARLRDRRSEAGSPSFGEIALRVGERRGRGAANAEQPVPARSTVYDCFRDGRRRVDVDLVLDIVAVLGAEQRELALWRSWCVSLQGESSRAPVALTSFAGLPVRSESFVAPTRPLGRARQASGAVTVVGMPGVGKTQLAAAAIAEDIEAGRARGAITVDVRASDTGVPVADSRAVLDAIARQLGLEDTGPTSDGEWAEQIAGELERTATAVLLDDVANSDQFDALVRAMTTRLIATSRSSDATRPATTSIEVSPWSVEETLDLLRSHLGDARIDREESAARSLASLTGGLPLATGLVAGRIARDADWSLADHGARIQARLARLHVEDGVQAAFSQSYDALGNEQRRALMLLAVQPCAHLPVSFVPVLLDRSTGESEALLRELRDVHLLEAGTRVWMHRLVRVFVLGRAWEDEPRSVRDAAVDRLADAYLEIARSADAEWFRGEVGHLIDIATAIAPRRSEVLLEVAATASNHLDAHGMFRSAESLQRAAYDAALRGTSDEMRTTAALALGRTLVRRGSPQAEAILTEALGWAQRADDAAKTSAAANGLAVIAAMQGDTEQALRRFREALVAAERACGAEQQARLHDNIAIVLRRLGRLGEAREHQETALRMADELGDDTLVTTVAGNLSELLLVIGDVDAALEAASRAVTLGGGDFWQANATNNLGRALSASGRHEEALSRHREALDLAVKTGAPVLVSGVHNDMAATYARAGDADAARRAFEEGDRVAREGGVAFERARSQIGIAELELVAGERDAAVALAREALTLIPDDDSPEAARARAVLAGCGAIASELGGTE